MEHLYCHHPQTPGNTTAQRHPPPANRDHRTATPAESGPATNSPWYVRKEPGAKQHEKDATFSAKGLAQVRTAVNRRDMSSMCS